MERCYITFAAVTYVLRAEKHLAHTGEEFLVVPIPREISTECGMCIICRPEKGDLIVGSLKRAEIPVEGLHLLKGGKNGFFKGLWK